MTYESGRTRVLCRHFYNGKCNPDGMGDLEFSELKGCLYHSK